MPTGKDSGVVILAISGGPDSVYLANRCIDRSCPIVLAHFNHKVRGIESDKDQEFVEQIAYITGLPIEIGTANSPPDSAEEEKLKSSRSARGFERKAREARYAFLEQVKRKHRASKVLVAHTADDQVETVLMRILEGAGTAGLKGIPKTSVDGIERPLLATWRSDILKYLKRHKIPFRMDQSNLDIRFERNWIRHVLLPLLEGRYGKTVKKRIFVIGERLREIDVYVENKACKWLYDKGLRSSKKNHGPPMVKPGKGSIRFRRKAYSDLPALLRIKILQILFFERIGMAPNERLLLSVDHVIRSGGPSARLSVGKRWLLQCRYTEAIFSPPVGNGSSRKDEESKGKAGGKRVEQGRQGDKSDNSVVPVVTMNGPGEYRLQDHAPRGKKDLPSARTILIWEEKTGADVSRIRRMSKSGQWAAFDPREIESPLSVRGLQQGDRIRPFGMNHRKKVKEILIDRKIPVEERWGRPVVCDEKGEILWIPGVIRSAHAPVTLGTRQMVLLTIVTDRKADRKA